MEERDLKILERAIQYMGNLKDGINPFTGLPVPEGELLKEERLQRCFAYVEDILRKYRLDSMEKLPFRMTAQAASRYEASAEPLTGTALAQRIHDCCSPAEMMTLRAAQINVWLLREGYLQEIQWNGKTVRVPTDRGTQAGILAEEAVNRKNEKYIRITYTPQAQFLILNHANEAAACPVKRAEGN